MEAPAGPTGPRARTGGLIVRAVGSETIVYDRATHRAHCLNDVARFVLDRCDGETPRDEIVGALLDGSGPRGRAEAEALVTAALEQLGQAGLLDAWPPGDVGAAGARRSRRATLHALGAACLAPLVLSLTAPTPAEAQTCRDRPCTSSRLCCPEAPCCRSQGPPGTPPTCRPGGGNPNCLP